jgi:hypothetical protein
VWHVYMVCLRMDACLVGVELGVYPCSEGEPQGGSAATPLPQLYANSKRLTESLAQQAAGHWRWRWPGPGSSRALCHGPRTTYMCISRLRALRG